MEKFPFNSIKEVESHLTSKAFNKLWIVGCPGSGKTTTAEALSRSLRLRHVPLDDLCWNPGWIKRPAPEFQLDISTQTEGERWIVDGNYLDAVPLLFSRADLLIWIQSSFIECLYRTLLRTSRRILSKEYVCNGNRETLSSFLKPDGMLGYITLSYRQNFERCKRFYDEFPGDSVILRE